MPEHLFLSLLLFCCLVCAHSSAHTQSASPSCWTRRVTKHDVHLQLASNPGMRRLLTSAPDAGRVHLRPFGQEACRPPRRSYASRAAMEGGRVLLLSRARACKPACLKKPLASISFVTLLFSHLSVLLNPQHIFDVCQCLDFVDCEYICARLSRLSRVYGSIEPPHTCNRRPTAFWSLVGPRPAKPSGVES